MPTKRNTKLIARALVAYYEGRFNYTEALRIVTAGDSLCLRDEETGHTYVATLMNPRLGQPGIQTWWDAAFITSDAPGHKPGMQWLQSLGTDSRNYLYMPPELMSKLRDHARAHWGVTQKMLDGADARLATFFSDTTVTIGIQRDPSDHVYLHLFGFADPAFTESHAGRVAQLLARDVLVNEVMATYAPTAAPGSRIVFWDTALDGGDATVIAAVLREIAGYEEAPMTDSDAVTVVRHNDLMPTPAHYAQVIIE